MLKQELPQRRRRGLAAAFLLSGLLLIPSTAAAMDRGAADVDAVGPDAVGATASVDELRTMVEDLTTANDALAATNTDLQSTIETLAAERDQLAASLDRFDALYDPLEADRKLLFELRKELPETRPEAERQLQRIRDYALISDPQGLGRLVDRVDETAPAFLDWRFGQFSSSAEFSAAYVETGANAFDSSFDELRSEALRTVANRLDGLLTILDRVR